MNEYKFMTYRETYNRIKSIGQGLLSIGTQPGDKILIFSETRCEWLLTAFAAFRHGITVVTLYATLGEEAVKHGINESQVSIIVTSHELLNKLEVKLICLKRNLNKFVLFQKILGYTKKIRHIIYFPPLAKSQTVKLPQNNDDIEYISLAQLEQKGNFAKIGKFENFYSFVFKINYY